MLMMSVLSLSVLHAQSWNDGTFKYSVINNTNNVSVAAFNVSGDVVVPAQVTYDNTTYNVTAVSSQGFEDCDDMTSVTLPFSIIEMQSDAFYGCTNLERADLSATALDEIAYEAFAGCSKLHTVLLPNSVTFIHELAFSQTALTSLDGFPEGIRTIGERAFEECNMSYIKVGQWESVGEGAFSGQQCEVTVDFSNHPTPPLFVDDYSGSSPLFGQVGPYKDENEDWYLGCLRIIVPSGSISRYLEHSVMGTYPYHMYRVKMKLGTHNGNTPAAIDYNLYNITPYQRLIATTSWKNDYLCLRPDMIIEEWSQSTSIEGEDPSELIPRPAFSGSPAPATSPRKSLPLTYTDSSTPSYMYSNTIDIFDEATHTVTPLLLSSNPTAIRAFMGTRGDDINIEQFDGFFTDYSFSGSSASGYPQSIMPYTVHTYHANAGTDDVPQIGRRAVADGIVPANTGVIIDFARPATYLVPPAMYFPEGGAVIAKYQLNMNAEAFDDMLTNRTWERADKSSLANNDEWIVYDWADLRNPVQTNPVKYKYYNFPSGVRVDKIREAISHPEQYDYTVEELTREDLAHYYSGTYSDVDYQCYWPDADQMYQDREKIAEHFRANHDRENDHNVIIGTPERYPLFPYWAESPYPFQDAIHDVVHADISERFNGTLEGGENNPLNFDYQRYGRMGKGVVVNGNAIPTSYGTFVNLVDVEEGNDALDNDIHYINFGVSKGYFVQTNSQPSFDGNHTYWMQPNRAYFSISRAHMPHIFNLASNGKLAIALEDNDTPTGITTINANGNANKSENACWYTLQGVKLDKQPTTTGIYIYNGKKIIVK